MNFKDLKIKEEYRSLKDDVIGDFYEPVLRCSKKYQRAVGFFSSSSLIEISKGLSGLVKNGGKIQLIASPILSKEDVNAIEQGLEKRDELVNQRLIESISEPNTKSEENRLNYLVNLIAHGILDIKIAVINNKSSIGIFHDKLGLMYDEDDNIIAFSGSMNESVTAFVHNSESFDVFKSWENNSDARRVENKKKTFEEVWKDDDPQMIVMPFPDAAKEKLFKYRKTNEIQYDIDETNDDIIVIKEESDYNHPHLPIGFEARDYQERAINQWVENGYVGIFDMATGSGKTKTSLAAAVKLFENRKAPLAVFIVAPYQHLVNQWQEEALFFGLKPIVCYSSSKHKKWQSKLSTECLMLEMGQIDCMCAIFTNATFATEKAQKIISKVKHQAVIIVDEAHYFGATNNSKFLDECIPYRMALSATLERHEDDKGTEKLLDYFGEKCITYTLKEAIESGKLTRYYYYPIIVNFNEDELEEYLSLSSAIGYYLRTVKKGDEIPEKAKRLMIKRARLVAATKEKVEKLIVKMEEHKNESHMLVYCGATTVTDIDFDDDKPPEDEKRQVDLVAELLGNKLNMKVAKFTAEEDEQKRKRLLREFDDGEMLQTLVAIKCLDEGVDVPSIRSAFILASSSNPKEYIQRRGRVLRLSEGKEYAYIYDFVVSPLDMEKINLYNDATIEHSKSLVKKELKRIKDFADLAENTSESDDIRFKLIDKYEMMEDEINEI